jgi:hypothetical protein
MKEEKNIKKYDEKDAKRIALGMITLQDGKDALLKEMTEKILPGCLSTDKQEQENSLLQVKEKGLAILRIFESESHVGLMETFNDEYRTLSREMCQTMIREFVCVNEAESALVELIVNAYIRVIDNSRRLNNELECKNITPNRNVYIANLSKQLDRANRQFLSALMTLQQLKTPQIEMNIKTTNAYVSHNQQINLTEKKDEIIKP